MRRPTDFVWMLGYRGGRALTLAPCKPLPQQRQDTLDALADILRNPADRLDRISALREVERAAKQMADEMAREMLAGWCKSHVGGIATPIAPLYQRAGDPSWEDRSEY
jgi:hypothetical protein